MSQRWLIAGLLGSGLLTGAEGALGYRCRKGAADTEDAMVKTYLLLSDNAKQHGNHRASRVWYGRAVDADIPALDAALQCWRAALDVQLLLDSRDYLDLVYRHDEVIFGAELYAAQCKED